MKKKKIFKIIIILLVIFVGLYLKIYKSDPYIRLQNSITRNSDYVVETENGIIISEGGENDGLYLLKNKDGKKIAHTKGRGSIVANDKYIFFVDEVTEEGTKLEVYDFKGIKVLENFLDMWDMKVVDNKFYAINNGGTISVYDISDMNNFNFINKITEKSLIAEIKNDVYNHQDFREDPAIMERYSYYNEAYWFYRGIEFRHQPVARWRTRDYIIIKDKKSDEIVYEFSTKGNIIYADTKKVVVYQSGKYKIYDIFTGELLKKKESYEFLEDKRYELEICNDNLFLFEDDIFVKQYNIDDLCNVN